MRLVVIDYGMGNLRSVARAMQYAAPEKTQVAITADPAAINAADRVVFPGQGAAADCMANIASAGLRDAILQAYSSKPFLGICMGLQILFDHSEENDGAQCLGAIGGDVVKFERESERSVGKIPHMGWNKVKQTRSHALWDGIEDNARFYFVHSYYVRPADLAFTVATTSYIQNFVSAVAHDNVFATQFHPEKSAKDGLRLLHNFTRWKI